MAGLNYISIRIYGYIFFSKSSYKDSLEKKRKTRSEVRTKAHSRFRETFCILQEMLN